MLSQLDVLPLILAASGAKPIADRVLDGRDPLPALTGNAPTPHHRLVFTYRAASALREGTLKIVRSTPTKPWELYDLSVDPGETTDLAPARAADVARLDAAYQSWLADIRRDASAPAPRPAAPN
jgi:arylsulfatase/uncharacterized sulfatase